MHASGHTYNQTCTCLCSSIKPPEHKQCGKPREMEKEKGKGWGGADDKGHASRKKERRRNQSCESGTENTGCEIYSEHESGNDLGR